MGYTEKYFVWDIEGDNVLYGETVGYEVEFSQDQFFGVIDGGISTANYEDSLSSRKIQYSIDDGETWNDYTYGEVGEKFYAPYKIRILLNEIDFGQFVSYSSGTISNFRNDLNGRIDSYSFSSGNVPAIETDNQGRMLFNDETNIYRVTIDKDGVMDTEGFSAFSDFILGLAIDEDRGTYWQVNQDSVYLRSLDGEVLMSASIPLPVESSSSSSGSSDSSPGL